MRSTALVAAFFLTESKCFNLQPVKKLSCRTRAAGEGPELPPDLEARMGTRELLPVQVAAYDLIFRGEDAVIHSPTGTGKTWSFVLPLSARLLESTSSKRYSDPPQVAETVKTRTKRKRVPVSPKVVVVAPSRELARQVGKEFSIFLKGGRVCTVFGGVPLERHIYQLRARGGTDVVVATAGRLRELMREEQLDFTSLTTLVLDEADILLNAKDQPEVKQFLDGMEHDYQLVLSSATINAHVRRFAKNVMELADNAPNFVSIKADKSGKEPIKGGPNSHVQAPSVQHSSLAASAGVRCGVAADLISTMNPRTAIVFVKTKSECEEAALELSQRLGGQGSSVYVLHGDIPQAARARTIAQLRAATTEVQRCDSPPDNTPSLPAMHSPRVLVATDVASRGLDLPGVDLVLQFGVPRLHGKEGTFDPELYTHRTGRAGRVGGGEENAADAVLLFDPSMGEAALLRRLEAKLTLPGPIATLLPPSSLEVMGAAFARAERKCSAMMARHCRETENSSLVSFFAAKIRAEAHSGSSGSSEESSEEELVWQLAAAMAALSGLDSAPTPRSLLTASPTDRTVQVTKKKGDDPEKDTLSPAEVTKLCKSLGSGKLGRVTILAAGNIAVFDLPARKAARLVEAANKAAAEGVLDGWEMNIPESLQDPKNPVPPSI